MAWTADAWRYSLGNVVDPSQVLDEQQTRLTLASVTVSSDLYEFTALQWDYDESLTLTITPLPDSGFDVTTRYAIGNVPAIGLTDSIDVAGSTTPTLGGLTVAFTGTHVGPSVDGAVETVLGGVSVSFTGEYVDRLYFNVDYGVIPTFVVTELPANFGALTPTLGGTVLAFTGYSLPPDSNQGLISTTLGGVSLDFDGTVALPPTYSGQLATTLADFRVRLTGSSVPASSNIGAIGATLSPLTVDFAGTFEKWNTDGAIGIQLGAITAYWQGQSVSSDVRTGDMDARLGGISLQFTGAVTLPNDLNSALMVIDDPGMAIMDISEQQTARMVVK